VNSLSRIFRAVLWGVVTGGLLSLVRQWSVCDARQMTHGQQPEKSSAAIRLYRDPVCGTYVSPEISFKLEKSGHITHFCSAECRDRYARPTARAAGA
jgi:YHS domain-containing protein